MTDRERLVQVITQHLNEGWGHEAQRFADALLAEGVTLPPPAGPVLTEDAKRSLAALHGYTGSCAASHVRLCPSCQAVAREVQNGLLTREEVERRAREWAKRPGYCISQTTLGDLLSALTRPAPGGPDAR